MHAAATCWFVGSISNFYHVSHCIHDELMNWLLVSQQAEFKILVWDWWCQFRECLAAPSQVWLAVELLLASQGGLYSSVPFACT